MLKYLSQTNKKSLRGTALLRLDFNTEDDWRMVAALPTIRFLLKTSERIVILSHRGRPKGYDKTLSLRSDATKLAKLLRKKVEFLPDFDFHEMKGKIDAARRGSIFVLENLRFLSGEEKNDAAFAKKLASLGDFYVNDAFAVSHRANASVVAITKYLPSYAGLEMEKEIKSLSIALKSKQDNLIVVLGGGKAGDKLGLLKYFKNKAEAFLLGGAPANTMLSLQGFNIGRSLADRDKNDLHKLKNILKYKNLCLPTDFVVHGGAILDIGTRAATDFSDKLKKARTIIWNGPMGFIEKKPYERGTLAVARAIANNKKAFSLVGGGETVMFLKKHSLDKKISFISTGGGAMLDFLAGEKLPGIVALENSKK
ncbi:MAG: phosphoglycerate kinase [Patescibacteria group bacterium]|nr:phosphoglycerate kinase [Patescibacteria group bacterium]MDE2015811.1 phosphoglycerate kinase [Patescibacteria group bacterium]MDE2227186.1 phosphoglycerate kinase [Patescibacteria group bacterium]